MRRHSASTASTSARVEPSPGADAERRATASRSDGASALGQPGQGGQQVEARLAPRRLSEHVQPAADLGVLQLAQIAVDVIDELSNVVALRGLRHPEVPVELGGDQQIPHLFS